mmetsp:Transcript_13733/g.29302  ORF Transcript_13733/g.29302 Transcript_13733/m.29302 type:complete len:182 (-) Transcript_13733:124-669(-)
MVKFEDIKVVDMELQPGHSLSLCMFVDVTNAAELRAAILRQSYEAAFINALMIADEFQILVAANKALHSNLKGSMTTKGLHTEVLFCLAASKSIADALSTFGISDQSKSIVIAAFDTKPDKFIEIASSVHGTVVPLSTVSTSCDVEKIKKVYKIAPAELSMPGSSLTDCAACRIAVRDAIY